MIERLVITALLITIGVLAWRWYTGRQLKRATAAGITDPLLRELRPGIATIVYFTTPMCIPCKTVQTPALKRVQDTLGESVQVIRIDATEQPEDADRWGVFSAPTTFVINAGGEAVAVNHGVADADTLLKQLGMLKTA